MTQAERELDRLLKACIHLRHKIEAASARGDFETPWDQHYPVQYTAFIDALDDAIKAAYAAD